MNQQRYSIKGEMPPAPDPNSVRGYKSLTETIPWRERISRTHDWLGLTTDRITGAVSRGLPRRHPEDATYHAIEVRASNQRGNAFDPDTRECDLTVIFEQPKWIAEDPPRIAHEVPWGQHWRLVHELLGRQVDPGTGRPVDLIPAQHPEDPTLYVASVQVDGRHFDKKLGRFRSAVVTATYHKLGGFPT